MKDSLVFESISQALLPRRRLLTLAFATTISSLIPLLAGCGGGDSNTGSTGSAGRATLTIIWPQPTPAISRLIPAAASSITISFLKGLIGTADITVVATQTVSRPATGNISTISFPALPAGDLYLKAEAFPEGNGTGNAMASGISAVTIQGGKTVSLSVTMYSTIDRMTVAPSTASVGVGDSITVSAAALDANGAIVLTLSSLTWSTSDASVATVSATSSGTGVVAGVALGTATITVTDSESGKFASAAITVAKPTAGNKNIVELANDYISLLTPEQRAATVLPFTAENAARWSDRAAVPNPVNGTNPLRNGVSFSTLTDAQKTAWSLLLFRAFEDGGGDLESSGYFASIRRSDNYLGQFDHTYSGDYEYVGFVGTPSLSGKWFLQVGGHHAAINHLYNSTTLLAATPLCEGTEPEIVYTPGEASHTLWIMRQYMYHFTLSLTESQSAAAKLTSTFTELYLGAGKDARGNFPTGTTDRGILCSHLTDLQKAQLIQVLREFIEVRYPISKFNLLYESEIDATYVAYSGTKFIESPGDYFRLDGPHLWLELIVLPGTVSPNGLEYRAIWRDRVTDYNAEFSF